MTFTNFIDQIGRIILAEKVEETETTLTVKNPVIIFPQPTQDGKLNIQTIPFYFRELLGPKSKEEGSIWKYNKANLVMSQGLENEPRILEQYKNIFIAVPTVGSSNPPKVVKLFDDAPETK